MVATLGQATIQVLADATGFSRSLERGLKAAFAGAVGVSATAGILKFTVDSTRAVNKFDQIVLKTFQLLPTYSQASFKEISGQMLELSRELGTSANSIAQGYYEAVGAGFSGSEALELTEAAAMGAAAAGSTLETTMDGLTSVLNSYGTEVISIQEASDVMFQTFNYGKASIDELASSVYDVVPVAASLGISFNDIGALMAVLTSRGVKAASATTQLRQGFNELSREGSKADLNFRAITGKAFPAFIREGGTVAQAVQVMAKRAKETDKEIQTLFVSASTGGAAFNILAKNVDVLQERLGQFSTEEVAGKTKKAYDVAGKGITETFNRAINRFKTAKLQLFTELKGVTDGIQLAFAQGVEFAANQMDRLVPVFATLVTAAGPYITRLVGWVKSLGPAVEGGLGTMVDKIGLAFTSMFQAFEQVQPAIDSFLNGEYGSSGLLDLIGNIFGALVDFGTGVAKALPAITQFFNGFFTVVGPLVLVLMTLADKVLPPLISAAGAVLGALGNLGPLFGSVGAVVGTVVLSLTGFAAAMGAVGVVVTIASKIFLAIQRVILIVRAAWIALGVAFAANPLGVVIAAVALLAVGLVYAYKKSETFRKIVVGAFNAVATAVGFAVKAIVTYWGWVADKILLVWQTLLEAWGNMPSILGGGKADAAAAAIARSREQVAGWVNSINAEIDRVTRNIHMTVTADTSQATQALNDLLRLSASVNGTPSGYGFNAREAERVTGTGEERQPLPASMFNTTGTKPPRDTDLGPTGTDFPEEKKKKEASKKAAEAALKAAKKALATAFKAIGKALDSLGRDTGKKTGEQLKTLYRTVTDKLKIGIEKATEAGNKSLATKLRAQIKIVAKHQTKMLALVKKRDALAGKLDTAKDKLADLRAESASFVASIKASVNSLGALTNDTGGIQSTFTGMRNNMRKMIAQSKFFLTAMKQLQALKLNPTALRQLTEAFQSDPTEGLRQAQILAKSGSVGVGEINNLQKQLDAAAGSLASNLNTQFYAAGISAAEGLVKGLQSQHNAIVAQMNRLADALVAQVKKKLKIASPSQVFEDEVGLRIPQGIAAGIRRGAPAAASEAARLAATTINLGGVQVNGVSDPKAALRAGVLAGQGISQVLRDRQIAAQLAGVV